MKPAKHESYHWLRKSYLSLFAQLIARLVHVDLCLMPPVLPYQTCISQHIFRLFLTSYQPSARTVQRNIRPTSLLDEKTEVRYFPVQTENSKTDKRLLYRIRTSRITSCYIALGLQELPLSYSKLCTLFTLNIRHKICIVLSWKSVCKRFLTLK